MRYIRTFEILEKRPLGWYGHILPDFVKHLIDFLTMNNDCRVYSHENAMGYNFYCENKKGKHHLFTLNKIDHYYEDIDMWFEFRVNINIKDWQLEKTVAKPKIPDALLDRVLFFYNVMKNTPKLTGFTQIPELIKKVSEEEFEFYNAVNNYNL